MIIFLCVYIQNMYSKFLQDVCIFNSALIVHLFTEFFSLKSTLTTTTLHGSGHKTRHDQRCLVRKHHYFPGHLIQPQRVITHTPQCICQGQVPKVTFSLRIQDTQDRPLPQWHTSVKHNTFCRTGVEVVEVNFPQTDI